MVCEMHTIDTKTIIVNLLKEDKKTYLSVRRLQKLLIYIYEELSKTNEIERYQVYFDINFDAIERTVLYNSHIFKLDIDGEIIYLREKESADSLARKYRTDDKIKMIINDFITLSAA